MLKSKKISNDQELIQSDPTSCPQNWQQFTKGTRDKPNEQLFPRQVVMKFVLVTAWDESYPIRVENYFSRLYNGTYAESFWQTLTLEVMLTWKSIIKYILVLIQWII